MQKDPDMGKLGKTRILNSSYLRLLLLKEGTGNTHPKSEGDAEGGHHRHGQHTYGTSYALLTKPGRLAVIIL